jgi:hypothetical protein
MIAIRRWRRQAGLVMLYLFVLPLETPTIVLAEARRAQQAQLQPGDPGWPRNYKLPNGGSVVIYQPQIQSWEDQKKIVMWSAVSYTEHPNAKPALGTIRVDAKTKVAVEERLVSFKDWELAEAHFKSLSKDQTEELVANLEQTLADTERVISLDRVLANLDKSQIASPEGVSGIKADPPKIFHSEAPAVLVNIDGQPIWSPIDGVDLKYAVNTNWDLFEDTLTAGYFLRMDSTWFAATSVDGPWGAVGRLPDVFSKLPNDSNWSAVRANVPGKHAASTPTIFISYEPAEMILTKGPPVYAEVKKTKLLWVSNTESDLFRNGSKGDFYYLVAGRWFSAPSLEGPWTFATPTLPQDFKRIPLDHPRSRVLASVPGTDQALDAVLLAQTPITAQVNKKETKAPEVTYQGEPMFDSIPGTSVARAVNTDKDIIKVGDVYYMCFQAVWFMSTTPTGPWQVASSVPKEIYQIPPSSPAYNVTYVTVEESDPNDEWETVAYVAAYTGIMIAWGCAVWGSGWYYPPYYYPGYRPIYYPYPHTYGFSAWYNPYTGAYGRGAAVYGPYGGAGYAASYNPRTGTYARGAAAYGPYNSRAAGQAYNPRTGTYASTRQGSNIYGNWGSSTVQRGDQWVQTAHKTNYGSGTTTSGVRTSEGGGAVRRTGPEGSGTIARTGGGDVYAGKDGNVYRKTDSGWQSWDNGGWSDVNKPSGGGGAAQQPANRPGAGGGGTQQPGASQQPANRPGAGTGVEQRPAPTSATGGSLDADRAARADGNARSSGVSNYSAGGGQRSAAGSYRGGGGRGGGRRR